MLFCPTQSCSFQPFWVLTELIGPGTWVQWSFEGKSLIRDMCCFCIHHPACSLWTDLPKGSAGLATEPGCPCKPVLDRQTQWSCIGLSGVLAVDTVMFLSFLRWISYTGLAVCTGVCTHRFATKNTRVHICRWCVVELTKSHLKKVEFGISEKCVTRTWHSCPWQGGWS